ncbi:MAG: flotillin family protein [Nitrospira sp.]|nr:flotillin family protein [bacterium]MBL7048555.1 flotillin family protein [Nitrospira sp.]
MNLWILPVLAFIILFISTLVFLASRFKRCPSDEILVVYGRVGEGQSANCIHGGGVMVWPLIQDYAFISLTPMTISIPLQNALSLQNIRINVPSTFTVGISTEPGIMTNAAERLLNQEKADIEEMAKEIIFGQLRLTVASLTIEQINQDRESFLDSIRKNVSPELNKIGLYLINVNITDITDDSSYISSIGKKAAAEAINQAKVDVAEQEKLGAIGESEATKAKEIRVAENIAEAEKGKKKAESERRIYVQDREAEAIAGENIAKANIADSRAELAVKQATAEQKGEVAKRVADVEIQKAQYKAEIERLNAEEVAKEEIEKKKVEIAAEAKAERTRREAKGEADAILLKYIAEADGIKRVLESKSSGYLSLVKGCNGDAKAAATLLMTEKIEDIVKLQVEAIRNLKIDKITVWDSGSGDGSGTTTSNFMAGLIKSLPPLHDVAGMAGIELPKYLGEISAEGNASVKKSPKSVQKKTETGEDEK